MGDVYNNIDDYKAKRKRKVLIVFEYSMNTFGSFKFFVPAFSLFSIKS